MNEIKCPKCGTVFQINEMDYESIVKQIRDKEFDKEIGLRDEQHKVDKDNAIKLVEAHLREELGKELSKRELEITELNGFKYKKGIHKTFDGHILDADKLCGNVTLRNRRNGDRIAIAGRGFTSKLKTLFNEKIALEERDKTAILCDDNGIIYVEHFGVDERVKVDEETLRILIIKIS